MRPDSLLHAAACGRVPRCAACDAAPGATPDSHRGRAAVLRAAAAAAGALLLAACQPSGPQAGGFGGFPPAPVTVQKVATADVPMRLELVGRTVGAKEAEVRARVQGILERRSYDEGARVTAGQPLFVIDPRPYQVVVEQAEAALAQARAQLAQARRLLERIRPLAGARAISQRELDDAVSAEEAAAAGVKLAEARLAEARLNLGYTTVRAPVAGLASRAQKSEGSLVSPGADSLLTTVSQVDPLRIDFGLSEEQRARLERLAAAASPAAAAGAPAGGRAAKAAAPWEAWRVSLQLADGSRYPREGSIVFVDPRINPATGTYDAQAEVANPQLALRPGQFVRVTLAGAVRRGAIVLPQRAVLDGPEGKFVYVTGRNAQGADVALPRPVQVGDWVDVDGATLWIVESGLKPGDTVVVEGTAKLFPVPGGAPIALGPPPGAAPAAPGAAGPAPAAAADGR